LVTTPNKTGSPEYRSGLFRAWYKEVSRTEQPAKPVSGEMMSVDDKKTKTTAPKKQPVTESKAAEAAPKEALPKTETVKTESVKTEGAKTEGVKAEAVTTDAAPSKKGMGEGQKPVTQAYKDNWNAIFGKKKKR
jgi:hypothetical protein